MEMLLTVTPTNTKLDKSNLIPTGMKIQAFSIHDQYTDKYLGAGSHSPCSAAVALKKIKEYTSKLGAVNVMFDLLDNDGRVIRSKRSYRIRGGDLVQPYPGADSILKDIMTPTPKPTNQAKAIRNI
jgi:hypothetical protein